MLPKWFDVLEAFFFLLVVHIIVTIFAGKLFPDPWKLTKQKFKTWHVIFTTLIIAKLLFGITLCKVQMVSNCGLALPFNLTLPYCWRDYGIPKVCWPQSQWTLIIFVMSPDRMRDIYCTCDCANVRQAGSWIYLLWEQAQHERAGSSSHWLCRRSSGFSALVTVLSAWRPSEGGPSCPRRDLAGRKLPGWDGHSSACKPW